VSLALGQGPLSIKIPGNWLWLLVLLCVVSGSAVLLVYSKHESRVLFSELQKLQDEQDRMDVEWGRLQLEQSAWATHVRVERLARKKLNMQIPDAKQMVILDSGQKQLATK
jgi:cell division protein FtsL